MSVYVDELQEYPESMIKPAARRYGNRWCHMIADSVPELVVMARKIQLSSSHIQKSTSDILHFDLTPSKRALAVRFGAIEVSSAEMIERIRGGFNPYSEVVMKDMEPEQLTPVERDDFDLTKVSTQPHLQANLLRRELEGKYNIMFGEEGIAIFQRHYDQVYSHFWKLLEKAELKAADKK